MVTTFLQHSAFLHLISQNAPVIEHVLPKTRHADGLIFGMLSPRFDHRLSIFFAYLEKNRRSHIQALFFRLFPIILKTIFKLTRLYLCFWTSVLHSSIHETYHCISYTLLSWGPLSPLRASCRGKWEIQKNPPCICDVSSYCGIFATVSNKADTTASTPVVPPTVVLVN